jgi:hypothetical protein
LHGVVEQPERGGCHRQAQVWQVLLVRDISRQTERAFRLVVSGTEVQASSSADSSPGVHPLRVQQQGHGSFVKHQTASQ